MPDNLSHGMMETFLLYLADKPHDPVLVQADSACKTAKACGAPFKGAHFDKAKIHTWLAWQDEPGKQLHEAVSHKVLNPTAEHAKPFVAWFRNLYAV